jgi:hypothetical protein
MTPAWSPSTTTRSPSRRPAPAGPRRRRARVPCRDADPDSRIHAPVTTAGIQGKQLKTEFRHVAARQLRSTSPVAHRAARPDSAEGSLPLIEYTASLAKELQFKVLWITTIWRWRRSLRAARTRTTDVLADVIDPIWDGLLDIVKSGIVILPIAFLRLALPIAAAVLLSLRLAGVNVWTAFIVLLPLSVLIQTVRLPLARSYWERLWMFASAGTATAAAVLLGLGLTGAHVWTAFIATLSLSVLLFAATWILLRWAHLSYLLSFASAGTATAAAVLLGFALTGAHVWTAFIITLLLSVLIPAVVIVRRRWIGLHWRQPRRATAPSTDKATRKDS